MIENTKNCGNCDVCNYENEDIQKDVCELCKSSGYKYWVEKYERPYVLDKRGDKVYKGDLIIEYAPCRHRYVGPFIVKYIKDNLAFVNEYPKERLFITKLKGDEIVLYKPLSDHRKAM